MIRRTLNATIELTRRQSEPDKPRRWPISISSDTPYDRKDKFSGVVFEEVLDHSPAAIDLSRAPLPFLESHDSMRPNIGIVDKLRTDGHVLRGELVLGLSARAAEIARDIDAGILRSVSVGYNVIDHEEMRDGRRIARRWLPMEASLVSIPADFTVGINRQARSLHMDEDEALKPQPGDRRETPEDSARLERARTEERERVTAISDLTTRVHAPRSLADRAIGDGISIERYRERVINHFADNDVHHPARADLASRDTVGVLARGEHRDGRSDFERAAVDAILLRAGLPVAQPHAATRDLERLSIIDIARSCLSRADRSSDGASPQEVLRRALGTGGYLPRMWNRGGGGMTMSDFPAILSTSVHAALRTGYEQEPASHRAWTRRVPVTDFRLNERPILGSAPPLKLVHELGEYEDGPMSEDTTSYKIAKFGRIVSLSWETLLADRLGAFLRATSGLGQAAVRNEADNVYSLFAENAGAGPTMQDSLALFHATHGNLTIIGAFGVPTLSAGRKLLRVQTALGGGYLSLVPRFLIVPPDYETEAEVLLASATRVTLTSSTSATTTAGANTTGTKKTTGAVDAKNPEWIARLELVVEPRLPAGRVYIAADTASIDTVELGVLEENMGGPVMEQEEAFRVDAQRWKVRHAHGAKALDWRGLVQIPIT